MVRIVRDTLQQTEPFTDPQELKAFVSKLYVYLVDEMYVALNKVTQTHTLTHTHRYVFICCVFMFIFILPSSLDLFR